MLKRVVVPAVMFAFALGCASATVSSTKPAAAPASQPPTLQDIAGQFALVAIDRHALPYALGSQARAGSTSAWPIVGGSLSLNPNGTFRIQTSYDTTGAVGSFEASGTCYRAESNFKMVWNDGGLTDLILRGDTLLLNKEGSLFAYLRR
jgi:hypothetical protein